MIEILKGITLLLGTIACAIAIYRLFFIRHW